MGENQRLKKMIEVILRIPKNKFRKVALMLQEQGVEIMKIQDAFDEDTYKKLEPIKLKKISGIVAIGGDALEDTEAVYDS